MTPIVSRLATRKFIVLMALLFPEAILHADGSAVTFRAPQQPGAYRLFDAIHNRQGGVATANVPLCQGCKTQLISGENCVLKSPLPKLGALSSREDDRLYPRMFAGTRLKR
jgi:hypothetical protein